MVDENTVTMVLYKDRTLANLQENPHAVFMIMEPGKTFSEWKGVRVYLKRKGCKTSGEKTILAIQSTAEYGEISRIVPFLREGGGDDPDPGGHPLRLKGGPTKGYTN